MKKFFALVMVAVLMAATVATAFAIAVFDEDGNIMENEPLPGGIMTLGGELETLTPEMEVIFDGGELPIFPAFRSVTGVVTEIWESDYSKNVRIHHADTEEGDPRYFHFYVSLSTFKMGDEIAVGDTITGFYDTSLFVPMIYPPQHEAAVIVNREGDLPRVIVERFDEDWISSAHDFRLNINEDTEIVFQGGDVFEGEIEELVGRKLVVEFYVSHRNLPETIPAPEKITILYERAVHPTIEIDWEDWDLPHYNFHYSPLRPLRETANELGFRVRWDSAAREIRVTGERGEVTLRPDDPHYFLETGDGVTLLYYLSPPVVMNGRTYVPSEFFRELMGVTLR